MLRPPALPDARPSRAKAVGQEALAPKVLVTGFDAFGGTELNSSWLAAQALHGRRIAGHMVVASQLPTVFGASLRSLQALLKLHQPVLVICLGLAGGRHAISLERVAINVDDARIADNNGAQPIDNAIAARGPAAYFSTLPIKAMLAAVQKAGIAAEVSQTAGTFVCNHVFYGLMHTLAKRRALPNPRGGFIHLPYLPEQGRPCMALEDMVRGLQVAIRCALKTESDARLGAGAEH